jgi:hypothetical protein
MIPVDEVLHLRLIYRDHERARFGGLAGSTRPGRTTSTWGSAPAG